VSQVAKAAQGLRWTAAARADEQRLKEFCCCAPEKKTRPWHEWRHSRSWELEAQTYVREDLPIPPQPPHYVLLAEDDQGIAAVSGIQHAGDFAFLDVMAVALRCRQQGIGRELMRRTVLGIAERAWKQGIPEVDLACKIDPRNEPSIRLVSSFRFAKVEDDLSDEAVEYDADGLARIDGEVVLDYWKATLRPGDFLPWSAQSSSNVRSIDEWVRAGGIGSGRGRAQHDSSGSASQGYRCRPSKVSCSTGGGTATAGPPS